MPTPATARRTETVATHSSFGSLLAAIAVVALANTGCGQESTPLPELPFTVTTLVSGLEVPWDMEWGPDSMLWVSERNGRISRVDPTSGQRTTAGTLAVRQVGESGLMGIALHPDFAHQPFVYAMHAYRGADGSTLNELVRARWDGSTLGTPEVLLDGIFGGAIHNGSRLTFGPDGMLYVSTGDAGATVHAQDRGSLNGKILRLTPDGRAAPDNPFGDRTWSYGHRNPQGLVFHPATGVLYETEHGPSDNDEINIIRRGGNYGWPAVHGRCDDDVSGERVFCRAHDVVEPLTTWTPTIAPTGADFYMSDRVPRWRGSLLFTALSGTLYRATLASDGQRITSIERVLNGYGRLRDVLVAANGDVYVSTSNRDGRGSARAGDDRILRLTPK